MSEKHFFSIITKKQKELLKKNVELLNKGDRFNFILNCSELKGISFVKSCYKKHIKGVYDD